MANPLYARMQATAQRLISKYGQAGTVTRIAPPDPVNGGDPVENAYPAVMVQMAYDQRYMDGTTIRAGDVQIYISSVGLPIKPSVGDTVLCGGVEYLVMNADPNNFDGQTNVVHIVQGRT